MTKTKTPTVDKNQLVVDQLIALLETGVKPWARPWKSTKDTRDFQNLFTRKAYSGINPLLCQISNMTHGYESPFFLSFNQAKQQDWKIIKGSKAANIRFTKTGSNEVEIEGENNAATTVSKKFFHQSWSSVFSLDCVDDTESDTKVIDIINKPENIPDNPDTPVIEIEQFLNAIGGNVEYGGDRAFYSPSKDTIVLPRWEQFKNGTVAVATHLHEYAHWTGHSSRLNRPGITDKDKFGSKVYAYEELVAEIAASMLTSNFYPEYSGVELENHASYLQSWLSHFKEEPMTFFRATSEAKKVFELLTTLGNR
jgi:antirestriction protein ArdC